MFFVVGLILISAACLLVKFCAPIWGIRLGHTLKCGLTSVGVGGTVLVLATMLVLPGMVFAYPASDVEDVSHEQVYQVIPVEGGTITVLNSPSVIVPLDDEEELKYYQHCPNEGCTFVYVDDSINFCPDCGCNLHLEAMKTCPCCGQDTVEGDEYCMHCGAYVNLPRVNFP